MKNTIEIPEAAKLLDMRPDTLRHMIKQDKFPQFATWSEMDSGYPKFVICRSAFMLYLKYGNLPPETLAILVKEDQAS